MIITLTRKLPDEGLKRKWVDKAGDLVKSKKVELRIWITLVLLERQHTVSAMDVEKN